MQRIRFCFGCLEEGAEGCARIRTRRREPLTVKCDYFYLGEPAVFSTASPRLIRLLPT